MTPNLQDESLKNKFVERIFGEDAKNVKDIKWVLETFYSLENWVGLRKLCNDDT